VKRILYIHHGGGIGGAPLSLLYLIQQLDRAEFEPVVVTLKPGPVVDLYRQNNIDTYSSQEIVPERILELSHTTLEWYGGRNLWRLPGRVLSIPASVRGTRKLVEHFQPDIVHLNSSTLAPSAIGGAQAGMPIVWHIREPLAKGYVGIRRGWIRRMIAKHADCVVAICQNDADQLLPNENIHVIYNFVDFDIFDRNLSGGKVREELSISPDASVVTMLGGIAEPKGTLSLVKALPIIAQAEPNVRVVIAGPPPKRLREPGVKGVAKKLLGVDAYQKEVQKAVDGLMLEFREKLIFTGIRQDIPQVIAASDIIVFPSVVPHFARPVIEAAAMGKPAIASDLGGPRELIVEGETGLLTPPRQHVKLAEAVLKLISDPVLASQMGEAGYKRALNLFEAQANAQATINLYHELLS